MKAGLQTAFIPGFSLYSEEMWENFSPVEGLHKY